MNQVYWKPTRQLELGIIRANSILVNILNHRMGDARIMEDKTNPRSNPLQNLSVENSSKQICITYIHMSPDLHPRTSKIKDTLEKHGFKFVIFKPKFRVNLKNRFLSSGINYMLFFWQSLFVPGDFLWIANCPDTVGIGPWLTGRKYVYDYRSPWSKEVEIEFGKGMLSKLAGMIEQRVRKKAYGIVVVSSRMLRDTEHLGKPLFTVPNYPSKHFVSSTSKESMRKLAGSDPDNKIILFVGKLSRVEGADMLAEIAEELSSLNGFELWIVGDGPLRSQIEDLKGKYPTIVKFFGWIDYKDVPAYITAADVCIVPRHPNPFSDYYGEEGVQKIAEYIALGKPVVACNIAQSDNYILVPEDSFIDGIKKAIDGKIPVVRKKFWESDSEPKLLEAINTILAHKDEKQIRKSYPK